jgi:hypothetical protein
MVTTGQNKISRFLAVFVLLATVLAGTVVPATGVQAQGAERINFPRGATSVNISGSVDNGAVQQYAVRAMAGQTMTVGAAYIAYPYQISVLDPSGRQIGATDAGSSWTGILPSAGDYFLIVRPGVSNARVFYNFVLSITGSTPPTPQPPSVERIRFAPGAISATVYGSLQPPAARQYVLAALAGQSMTVQTNSNGPFQLTVSGADGSTLGSTLANQPITVRLPRTQDYFLTLSPVGGAGADYTLQVTVVSSTPPTATPTPRPAQAQRIRFAPGAVSATVNGYAAPGRPASYVLGAMAGQDMTVQFYGNGPFQATLTGADGSFLGSTNNSGTISARLPRTQDYFITVNVPADAGAFNFTMVVTIVGSAVRPTPPPSTQRITFAPGAVSATVNGGTPQNYVLKALRNQTMYVELFTNGAPVQARIETANGQLLGTADQNNGWSGVLPATQDYYFRVSTPWATSGTPFTLRVTIY